MANKLLNNSLSILLILVGIYTTLLAAFWVLYVLPWFFVYATYTFYEGLYCFFFLLFLAIAMILVARATKSLIINIGCEPN
jgi:ABC-type transport system involved in multi-copper enzyme maturation permease subunit